MNIKMERLMVLWTRVVGIFTGALVGVGVVTAIIFWKQLTAMQGQLEELTNTRIGDQRAWIAPTGAKIDGDIIVGSNLRIKVLFENTGKEVALNTLHIWDWGVFPVVPDAVNVPFIGAKNVPWPRNDTCGTDVSKYRGGRPIYPSAKYEDIRYVFTGPAVPQTLLDKRSSFYVFGCFIYRSFDRGRHSPYCLYFQPNRDKPIEQSTFEFCPLGSGIAD